MAHLPELRPGAEVADVLPWGGTSTAALRRHLGPDILLHTAELSSANLDFIDERMRQEGLAPVRHDGLIASGRLPFSDGSLDAVCLIQTLEHCPDPQAMLDEARRVLKPGGALLVSARNLWSRYGLRWARVERRAQIPNQGPFRPIPAPRLRRWLADRFTIERETGVGRAAVEDAQLLTGPRRFFGRLFITQCRK
jgi:SAM-dependent methyltransferase